MQNLLMDLMEFLIEMGVFAAAVMLIAIIVSIPILRYTDLYKRRVYRVGMPVAVAVAFGQFGLTDYTSLRQWAYFTMPGSALSVLFVWSYFRKRLQQSQP